MQIGITMKKIRFFGKALFVVLIVFFFCFIIIMPQYQYNYQASLIDKVERLESVQGPKIILIGNSNLAFGMNSELLEKETGMPVVNMGLHGGVGNVFNEQAATLNIDKGDLVIVCHSNYSDDDKIKNPEMAWITIENHLSLWRFMRLKDIPQMAEAYPTYLRKCIDLWGNESGNLNTDTVYSRTLFNKYGDVTLERTESQPDIDFSPVTVPEIADVTVKRLNHLNQEITDQGGTMVVAGYPIAWYEQAPSKESYQAFGQELDEKLDCPVISDFTQYCFPKEYFYNTYLHMTNEGADARTRLLASDIQKYLANKEAY